MVIPEIQDSSAVRQSRMGESHRCRQVVLRTPDMQTLFNAICVCIYCIFSHL